MRSRIAIVLAILGAAGLLMMAVAVSAVDDSSIRGTLRPQIWYTMDDYSVSQAVAVSAVNGSPIRGTLRPQIWYTMDDYIVSQTVDGTMRLYDPIEDKALRLDFVKIHEGIVRKGDFFVSCADFVDQYGRKLDVDILVLQSRENLQVTQAIVHEIDGAKRKYHLASSSLLK
jgi:hypothetical protein